MCGRFALGIPKKRLEEVFGLPAPEGYVPRYNVAPGQPVAVVSSQGFAERKWGLVPHWADDPQVGYSMINARSETVFEKPSFRDAVRTSRCLVPAQAFYEWKRDGMGKQPYAIGLADTDVFAMAGIMARWQSEGAKEIVESMAILTCPANKLLSPIHDRMPVILAPDVWAGWLSHEHVGHEGLAPLLTPYPAAEMRAWTVGSAVNRVANEGPKLLEPIAVVAEKQGTLF